MSTKILDLLSENEVQVLVNRIQQEIGCGLIVLQVQVVLVVFGELVVNRGSDIVDGQARMFFNNTHCQHGGGISGIRNAGNRIHSRVTQMLPYFGGKFRQIDIRQTSVAQVVPFGSTAIRYTEHN